MGGWQCVSAARNMHVGAHNVRLGVVIARGTCAVEIRLWWIEHNFKIYFPTKLGNPRAR